MTAPMPSEPSPDIPEGMASDARETWPSRELIDSFLGTGLDFELRLGEHTPIPIDDPEAAERARSFRDVLGLFATGVTVVTSLSDGEPVGMTCQSFSSVSLDPPLVMFCPAKTSRAWPSMRRSGFFCVNFLAADQRHISNGMATKGTEKFDGVGWRPASTGAPLIAVTTVTPEANRPSTSRNRRAAATASGSSASTKVSSPGRNWKSYIESPSHDSIRSWLGQVSRASCRMPSGISASLIRPR